MECRSVVDGVMEMSTRPKCEKCGEDDADGGVVLEVRFSADGPDEADGEQCGDQRADGERDAQDIGDNDAGEDGVRDRVAEERPSEQDYPGGEKSGAQCRHRGDDDSALHKAIGEGFDKR